MMRLVALLCCIGLICAEEPLNHSVHNEKVVGGSDAPRNKWQWQVSLQYDSYGEGDYYHICGGTIIDAFYIMTAAHCILDSKPGSYRIVVGEHNIYELDGSEQFCSVEEIIVHPDYNGETAEGNDIALMKLVEPVYGNGFVAIAALPAPGETLPHDFTCYVTGWGRMGDGNGSPAIMQEAPLKVVEHSVCSQPGWWGGYALESMVCAGGDGITSGCQGDSGGPLSCLIDDVWRVHGVVSFGPAGKCNLVSKPTVFTRVSSFIDWIYSILP